MKFPLALCAASVALPVWAEGLTMDQAISLATTESAAWCKSQDTTLELAENAATQVDLTGDGSADDWIISEVGAWCGPNGGPLGGSGGGMTHAIVGTAVSSWMAGSWMLQDLRFVAEGEELEPVRTLLLAMHGTYCDSFGAAPCILAVTWDGERLIHFTNPPPN